MTEPSQNASPVKLSHYISYGIYRSFEYFLKLFPMEVVCTVGGLIGSLAAFILPSRRATVIRNLRIAYGEHYSHSQIQALCRRTYWNVGSNLIASIKANNMKSEDLLSRMEFVGMENLALTRKEGDGLILLLAHMGSWEILVQMHLTVPGLLPFGGLYRPLSNPLLDKLVKQRRQQTGTKLFSRKDGFFTPMAHLKDGGTLGAFSDQNVGKRGMAVSMFGKLMSLTNLPALLYRRTGAPIVPVSMRTTGLGKWRVTFHPALEISDTDKTNAAVTTALCAKAYESMMAESPADILWMHGYWKLTKKAPLKISGIQKKKNRHSLAQPTKPFKILLFTGNTPANDQEMLAAIKLLKNHRQDAELTIVSEFLKSPDARHHLRMNSSEPPHIIGNTIYQHDLAYTTPIDCAIDLTPDASGEKILKISKLQPCFSMQGRNQSAQTKALFKNPEKQNTLGLLESLGMEI